MDDMAAGIKREMVFSAGINPETGEGCDRRGRQSQSERLACCGIGFVRGNLGYKLIWNERKLGKLRTLGIIQQKVAGSHPEGKMNMRGLIFGGDRLCSGMQGIRNVGKK